MFLRKRNEVREDFLKPYSNGEGSAQIEVSVT